MPVSSNTPRLLLVSHTGPEHRPPLCADDGLLTSSFAPVVITSATRGRRLTSNVSIIKLFPMRTG